MLGHLAPGVDLTAVEANFTLVRAFGAVQDVMEPYLASFGLSPARLTFLRVLYQAPGHRLTMGEIRQRLNVTSTNVSKLAAGLERHGWVKRTVSERDRRVVYGELTPAGRAEFEARVPGALQKMAELWQGLNHQEQETAIALLQKLWYSVQEASHAPSPAGRARRAAR